MKPRKIQILKNFIANDERAFSDPLSMVILEGLVKLFEWNSKMLEIFPNVENNEDYIDYCRRYAAAHCPGYYCSFSENFLIEDESAAKPFEASEAEQVRDIHNWSMISVCTYVRDLADVYRKQPKVRDLVDSIIEGASDSAKEKRSFRNILSRAWFMNDFQRERFRIMVIDDNESDD